MTIRSIHQKLEGKVFYCSAENECETFYVVDGILKFENKEELYGSEP